MQLLHCIPCDCSHHSTEWFSLDHFGHALKVCTPLGEFVLRKATQYMITCTLSDLSTLLDTPNFDADQQPNNHYDHSQNSQNDSRRISLSLLRSILIVWQKQCQWHIRDLSYHILSYVVHAQIIIMLYNMFVNISQTVSVGTILHV